MLIDGGPVRAPGELFNRSGLCAGNSLVAVAPRKQVDLSSLRGPFGIGLADGVAHGRELFGNLQVCAVLADH